MVGMYRGEPIVMVTMPGTGLPLPYQLSSAKERAERQLEASGSSGVGALVDARTDEDRQDEERAAALMRLFASFKPGLPIPRELLDHDTALVQSTSRSWLFALYLSLFSLSRSCPPR
jgi:hypothetical protein